MIAQGYSERDSGEKTDDVRDVSDLGRIRVSALFVTITTL
jgi:hypothetical protein